MRELTPLNLGHDRLLRTAFASNTLGRGRIIFEAQFDSGFGERRRRFRFAVLTIEMQESPRMLMITRDPVLASAARRPGFAYRDIGGMYWVSDDATELELARTRLSSWFASAPTQQTVEFRSGHLAVYLPGDLNAESQASLTSAADALLGLMQAAPR